MKSHLVSKLWALIHSPVLMLIIAVGTLTTSIAAGAQDAYQIDPQHSVVRLSLGSGQNALDIGLARVSGTVVFDSNDPADPTVSLTITPGNTPLSEYAQMGFTSKQSSVTADGRIAVTGMLSVTRIERTVTAEPNEAYAGPQYGEPVAHTDTREVTLVFSDPTRGRSHNTMKLSGATSLSLEAFPQFVDAVTDGDWPTILVDDEQCQEPSTIGEDYSGATCTGDVIAKVANRVVMIGTAGGEDYSGFRPAVIPDRNQATMALDLKLTELPASSTGSPTTQTTR